MFSQKVCDQPPGGDALAGTNATFAADNVPELIRAAVPFSLKLVESLLADSPRHEGLLLAAAPGITQYANAFVEEDADELNARIAYSNSTIGMKKAPFTDFCSRMRWRASIRSRFRSRQSAPRIIARPPARPVRQLRGKRLNAGFQDLLRQAIAIDVYKGQEHVQLNLVMQRRACWLLSRTDKWFPQ